MELRYRREAAVGVLVAFAATVFVLLMMWLRGQSLRRGDVVRARFTDVAGLKVGDPVRTSGVTVGQVRRIALGSPGTVDVWFSITDGPAPRRDAAATLRSADLFGAMFLDYHPGNAAEPLRPDTVLEGTRAPAFTEMAGGFADPARQLLGNATDLLSPATARELRAVLVEARRTLESFARASEGPSRQLTGALAELRSVLQRMDQMVAANQQTTTSTMRNLQGVSENVERMTATLTRTTRTLDSILVKVNAGRGALGALVNDTTLMGEIRATNNSLRALLEDLRANPGRYFRLRL